MKANILIVMMALILSACNGGGGGSSPVAPIIDNRFYQSDWQTSYVVGTSNWVDELEFVGDQVVWTRTQYFGGGIGGPYVETYQLTATSPTSFQSRDVTDDSIGGWTYGFTGATLNLRDSDEVCSDFVLQ